MDQRLLNELATLLTEDFLGSGSLKEISLIPPSQPHMNNTKGISMNASQPSAYQLIEKNNNLYLGIPVWVVQSIMPILSKQLVHARAFLTIHSSSADLSYRTIFTCHDVLQVSRLVLCMAADHGTALNLRKEVLQTQTTTSWIINEINVSNALLSRSPSSSVQWRHRLWVIEQEITHCNHVPLSHPIHLQLELAVNETILVREHRVISLYASRKLRNYYAWVYRKQLRILLTKGLDSTRLSSFNLLDQKLVNDYLVDGHGSDRTALNYISSLNQ